MALSPCENLRSFVQSRPPLVVFMVCMGMFAVVLVSISYYIKYNQIRNPEVSEDWNMFLESFSELNFCVMGNSTDSNASPISTTKPLVGYKAMPNEVASHLAYPTTTMHSEPESRNYSVSMLLEIHPTPEFLAVPHNVTHLTGSIQGKQLGLKGQAADELINISAALPYEWNNTKCVTGLGCDTVKIYTCVQFTASSRVFPISRSPPMCENLNETGIDYHVRLEAYKPKHVLTAFSCTARPVIHIQYKLDPSLTVWLSLRDRSVINLHLMHTSYFLFVMVITLLCYAIIRGNAIKAKYTQTDKIYLNVPTQA